MLEAAILDKKRQVEQLVNEMKEANLQSLSGTTDEIRHLLEGMFISSLSQMIETTHHKIVYR